MELFQGFFEDLPAIKNLFPSKVELLRGPFWLNDQVIAFYFQYLESVKYVEQSQVFLFVSPSITQLLKLSLPDEAEESFSLFLKPLMPNNKEVFFFPVNNNSSSQAGGTHWSLLVYSRLEESFFSFDSLSDCNKSATITVVAVLKEAFGVPWAGLQFMETLQQTNAWDCGIFVLANTENICDCIVDGEIVQHVSKVDKSSIANKRQDILELIQDLGGNIESCETVQEAKFV